MRHSSCSCSINQNSSWEGKRTVRQADTDRQRAEQTRLRMWHSYSCSRVATVWLRLCHSQRRLAVPMWQEKRSQPLCMLRVCGQQRMRLCQPLPGQSTINWPTVIGNVSAAWQWLLPIGIELAPRRMLSMGTGTGMAMGAEELGSNPLHVPVACAAYKLTTSGQVDKWTSGQPLRVCLGTETIDAMQKCC